MSGEKLEKFPIHTIEYYTKYPRMVKSEFEEWRALTKNILEKEIGEINKKLVGGLVEEGFLEGKREAYKKVLEILGE